MWRGDGARIRTRKQGKGAGIEIRRLERCSTLNLIASLGPIKSVYKGKGGMKNDILIQKVSANSHNPPTP